MFANSLIGSRWRARPLSSPKLLKADPARVQAQSEEIKARYSKIFGGVMLAASTAGIKPEVFATAGNHWIVLQPMHFRDES